MTEVCWGIFMIQGWVGAIAGLQFLASGGDENPLITSWLAVPFILVGAILFILGAMGFGSSGPGFGIIVVALFIVFMGAPYGAYGAAFLVYHGGRFFSPNTSMTLEKTYDKGDGAMHRREYEEAINFYRQDLVNDPHDVNALFRLSDAMRKADRPKDAAKELEAYLDRIHEADNPDRPWAEKVKDAFHQRKTQRNKQMVQLSFALGDLYTDHLNEPDKAKELYTQTLGCLGVTPDTEPLESRLKLLPS